MQRCNTTTLRMVDGSYVSPSDLLLVLESQEEKHDKRYQIELPTPQPYMTPMSGEKALAIAMIELAVVEALAPHRGLPCARCHAWLWLLDAIPPEERPVGFYPVGLACDVLGVEREYLVSRLQHRAEAFGIPWAHPSALMGPGAPIRSVAGSTRVLHRARTRMVGAPGEHDVVLSGYRRRS